MAYIKDVELELVTAKGDVLVRSIRWIIFMEEVVTSALTILMKIVCYTLPNYTLPN